MADEIASVNPKHIGDLTLVVWKPYERVLLTRRKGVETEDLALSELEAAPEDILSFMRDCVAKETYCFRLSDSSDDPSYAEIHCSEVKLLNGICSIHPFSGVFLPACLMPQ